MVKEYKHSSRVHTDTDTDTDTDTHTHTQANTHTHITNKLTAKAKSC